MGLLFGPTWGRKVGQDAEPVGFGGEAVGRDDAWFDCGACSIYLATSSLPNN